MSQAEGMQTKVLKEQERVHVCTGHIRGVGGKKWARGVIVAGLVTS